MGTLPTLTWPERPSMVNRSAEVSILEVRGVQKLVDSTSASDADDDTGCPMAVPAAASSAMEPGEPPCRGCPHRSLGWRRREMHGPPS